MIPGGQDLSRRQTIFFLPIDPRNTNHKDPEHIDFSVPRLAQHMHSAWKKHQDAVLWVDINLAIREVLTFYQTRSNAIILQETLPAHCIFHDERLKTGEVLYERRYLFPRPPPKISLRHDHNWTWRSVSWKTRADGGSKRKYQYCSDYLGSIIYLRAFQWHSGDSITDLAMQDHVLIGRGVFLYIYHVGDNFNISSILSNGLISGGQNLSRRQSVFFAFWSKKRKSQRSRKYWLLCAASCPIRAKHLEKSIRIRYSGLILILESSKKDWCSIRQDRTQSSFRVYFQQVALWELKDWKAEKHCTKDDSWLLDHHRRSFWNTITIGPKEMINWVPQLSNSQSENSYNSHLEKHFKLDFPSQPKPNLIQLVIERWNLWTKRLLVSRKENLGLLIERVNLWKMKKNASWEITIERGTCGRKLAQSARSWFSRTSW